MSNPIVSHRLPGTGVSSCQADVTDFSKGQDSSVFLCTTFLWSANFEYKARAALASLSCLATLPVLPFSMMTVWGRSCMHVSMQTWTRDSAHAHPISSALLVGFVIRGAAQTHAHLPVGLFQKRDDNLF